ncbi:MAG: NHL repeat-containing protein [Candidatus Omnitrophica bacterium]|nr:NHL repeat-containing protein [Armatimonadota bacterium]MBI3011266.1 NHL repeat-containing protein [Candidatus Omnitrophota bacterium]
MSRARPPAAIAWLALLLLLGGCGATPQTSRWVATWEGHGLEGPIGVAVDADGSIYVSDSGHHRIVQLSPAGELLRTFGGEGSALGQLDRPMHIATDSTGRLYVAEYLNDRIQLFDGEGHAQGTRGDGIFDAPSGVAVDREGAVYIADFYHDRVVKLSLEGDVVSTWGQKGRFWAGRLHYPTDVAIGAAGEVIVADAYNHRIQVFSTDGEFIRMWGGLLGLGVKGNSQGQFHVATGVGVDTQGRVYVADFYNHRVQVFSSKGRWLGSFGAHGTGPGEFDRPTDVAIAPDGTIYVVDFGNNRLQLFRVERG